MILSVSRRTDIPAFYFDWFWNRLQEGFLLVENPRNPDQLSRVELVPEKVDCMVFWSKNPAPMLPYLLQLEQMGYPFYIQFTLTPYGPTLEPHFSQKNLLVDVFRSLSRLIGPQRVVWRYDPIILDLTYTTTWHLEQFATLYHQLNGYTRHCVISFVDPYSHLHGRFSTPLQPEILHLAEGISHIVQGSIELSTCAESLDLSAFGIRHGACIDQQMIERLLGCPIRAKKDPGQRPDCGCIESVDVGTYNTCPGGCAYCYAVQNPSRAVRKFSSFCSYTPALCRDLQGTEKITIRQMPSVKSSQLSLFSPFHKE